MSCGQESPSFCGTQFAYAVALLARTLVSLVGRGAGLGLATLIQQWPWVTLVQVGSDSGVGTSTSSTTWNLSTEAWQELLSPLTRTITAETPG